MADRPPPQDEADQPRRRFRWPFGWLGLLALAWLVYELTASPALGVSALCLKFGWEDFRSGWWLYRCDPDRRRGRCCLWLYVSWGLLDVAGVALLMAVGYAGFLAWRRPAQVALAQVLEAFAGTFLTGVVALSLAVLGTTVSALLAWWSGTPLWLDSAVHRARRHDDWPPTAWCHGRHNRLPRLLRTACVVNALLVLLFAVVAAGWARGPLALGLALLLGLCAPVLAALGARLMSRIDAATPEDCWGDAPWQEGGSLR